MNTEQILKAASPRPWQRGLWAGDSAQGAANSALCKLAVNSYEAREVLLGKLTAALEDVYNCGSIRDAEKIAESALAAARKVQP